MCCLSALGQFLLGQFVGSVRAVSVCIGSVSAESVCWIRLCCLSALGQFLLGQFVGSVCAVCLYWVSFCWVSLLDRLVPSVLGQFLLSQFDPSQSAAHWFLVKLGLAPLLLQS